VGDDAGATVGVDGGALVGDTVADGAPAFAQAPATMPTIKRPSSLRTVPT